MSLDLSKKVLKISGIFAVVVGIFGIIFGALAVAGGGMITASQDYSEFSEEVTAAALVGGIVLLVMCIISLIEGILSVRAASDSAKIMPAWVFAILGIASSVIDLITSFGEGVSGIFGSLVGLALSILIFVAANTIKNSR